MGALLEATGAAEQEEGNAVVAEMVAVRAAGTLVEEAMAVVVEVVALAAETMVDREERVMAVEGRGRLQLSQSRQGHQSR